MVVVVVVVVVVDSTRVSWGFVDVKDEKDRARENSGEHSTTERHERGLWRKRGQAEEAPGSTSQALERVSGNGGG